MVSRYTIAISSALLALGGTEQAKSQDAAESAIILGGTAAAQTKGQRSLGAAIIGSIGRAATAVNVSAEARSNGRHRAANTRFARRMILLPADVDPLEDTDASTYKLANGASIRVSGRLRPAVPTSCESNCPAQ